VVNGLRGLANGRCAPAASPRMWKKTKTILFFFPSWKQLAKPTLRNRRISSWVLHWSILKRYYLLCISWERLPINPVCSTGGERTGYPGVLFSGPGRHGERQSGTIPGDYPTILVRTGNSPDPFIL
jgi:hypothetical protein